MVETSDWELIVPSQNGDRDAFRCLFEMYEEKVFSIALRFSGDTSVAMDIRQETFLKLFSCICSFRADSTFETWVYRVMVNVCLEHRRRTRRLTPVTDELVGTFGASADSFSELLRAELHNLVRSVVKRLSPDLRTPIGLRYTEELSTTKLRWRWAARRETVASRLNRAHKVLHRRVAHLARPSDSPGSSGRSRNTPKHHIPDVTGSRRAASAQCPIPCAVRLSMSRGIYRRESGGLPPRIPGWFVVKEGHPRPALYCIGVSKSFPEVHSPKMPQPPIGDAGDCHADATSTRHTCLSGVTRQQQVTADFHSHPRSRSF